ncbi:reverse transcriptase domain-containing protein [Artemisia annua]|uniref:Reverse transcriptase domain-containing protein n=1 Tax=Artemisia annua TaxID=35608 RepID=A0A2U1NS22_ARTAN|nr:reverse transcriptase domain-containing protein [Artemisia annua]
MKLREGLFPIDIRRPSLGVKLLRGAVRRTCQPVHMEEAALFFDKGLRGSIENIVVCGGPYFGDLQWHLASLPIRFGGLGLYSAKVVSSYAFDAVSRNISLATPRCELCSAIRLPPDFHYTLGYQAQTTPWYQPHCTQSRPWRFNHDQRFDDVWGPFQKH